MTSSLSSLPSGRFRPPISLLYSSLIIQSSNFCLGLPLPLLPSILPFIISLLIESPLIICPIQFRCLVLIIVNKDLSSSTSFNTSFDMCSVQLIFSVLYPHFKGFQSCDVLLLRVHVSAKYKVALQINVFTILFLRHLHTSQSSPW